MKVFITLLILIVLSNCTIKPNETIAQDNNQGDQITSYSDGFSNDHNYKYVEQTKENMKYGIWYLANGTSQTGYTIAVVNLTKEELEIELIKLQIEELHLKLRH